MANLYLFNPENDLALAVGHRQFTPPRGAMAIAGGGRELPLLWCDADDYVIVKNPAAMKRAEQFKRQFGLQGTPVAVAPQHCTPEPWGWSRYARSQFLDFGVDPALLPDDATLERYRNLSHRRTTIEIHRQLATPTELIPVEATSLDQVMELCRKWDNRIVVKLPWSSSGRGVVYSDASPEATFRGYVEGMIRRQGSVLVEPRYERLRDFAMLFHCRGGVATYRGLSAFATDGRGFYAGNIVAAQGVIAEIIGVDVAGYVAPLAEALTRVVAPDYDGWVGVDMMIYRAADGSEVVAPCVEANLRMTMGVAAMYLANHLADRNPLRLLVTPQGVTLL